MSPTVRAGTQGKGSGPVHREGVCPVPVAVVTGPKNLYPESVSLRVPIRDGSTLNVTVPFPTVIDFNNV